MHPRLSLIHVKCTSTKNAIFTETQPKLQWCYFVTYLTAGAISARTDRSSQFSALDVCGRALLAALPPFVYLRDGLFALPFTAPTTLTIAFWTPWEEQIPTDLVFIGPMLDSPGAM